MTEGGPPSREARKGRRALAALGILSAISVAIFVAVSLSTGARADACAAELLHAIEQRDNAFVDRAVRNPSVRDALLGADHVELGFVRPMSTEWTRVGLFVRPASTSTEMKAIVLQLGEDTGEGCVFLRDYESGAFGAGP